MYVFRTGLGWDAGDPIPTPLDEALSTVGVNLIFPLLFPWYLVDSFLAVFGLFLPGWTAWLSGIIYAVIIVFLYNRWQMLRSNRSTVKES